MDESGRITRPQIVAQKSLAASPGSPELVKTMEEIYNFKGRIMVSNKSGASRTYRLYVVPEDQAGPVVDTNQIAWDIPIGGVPHVRELELGPGDSLYGRMGAGVADDITVTLVGDQKEI